MPNPDTIQQVAPARIRPTQSDEIFKALDDVKQQYPIFQGLNVAIKRGEGPGQLEFFPPDESLNPNPGQLTIEIRNPELTGDFLRSAIAGDLLHHLGGRNRQGQAYNPKFRAMKDQFVQSMTPDQMLVARHMYQRAKDANQLGPQVTFEDFLDFSASDEFIRGFIFPDKDANFLKPGRGAYTKEQRKLLQQMKMFVNGTKSK